MDSNIASMRKGVSSSASYRVIGISRLSRSAFKDATRVSEVSRSNVVQNPNNKETHFYHIEHSSFSFTSYNPIFYYAVRRCHSMSPVSVGVCGVIFWSKTWLTVTARNMISLRLWVHIRISRKQVCFVQHPQGLLRATSSQPPSPQTPESPKERFKAKLSALKRLLYVSPPRHAMMNVPHTIKTRITLYKLFSFPGSAQHAFSTSSKASLAGEK